MFMKKIILFIILLLPVTVWAQSRPDTAAAKTPVRKTVKQFPFVIDDGDPEYDLSVNLADQSVHAKLAPVFQRNNMPFTADALQEVMIQLLEKENPQLAQNITYLTDEKLLYINTGNKLYQETLLNIVRPVMYESGKLDAFLKSMNRDDVE